TRLPSRGKTVSGARVSSSESRLRETRFQSDSLGRSSSDRASSNSSRSPIVCNGPLRVRYDCDTIPGSTRYRIPSDRRRDHVVIRVDIESSPFTTGRSLLNALHKNRLPWTYRYGTTTRSGCPGHPSKPPAHYRGRRGVCPIPVSPP